MFTELSSHPHERPPSRLAARLLGIGALVSATVLLLALGILRQRFGGVPDVGWFAMLVTLLAGGGAMTARAVPTNPAGVLRRRVIGLSAVLMGGVALGFGVLSTSTRADGWSDGARAGGALAFCLALAILPFGLVLLRRMRRKASRVSIVDPAQRPRSGADESAPPNGSYADNSETQGS